ncbi:hypothetical protein GCM10010484_60650 [Actinokineospora globicatena]
MADLPAAGAGALSAVAVRTPPKVSAAVTTASTGAMRVRLTFMARSSHREWTPHEALALAPAKDRTRPSNPALDPDRVPIKRL